MKRNLWVLAAAVVLVLIAAGYTIAQTTGAPQGWMTGSGMMGMMGGGMMGQSGQDGQGGMMGSGTMGVISGQPLTQEQLEQFAKQHGITVEQAKQMTDTCTKIMAGTAKPETPKQ